MYKSGNLKMYIYILAFILNKRNNKETIKISFLEEYAGFEAAGRYPMR